MDIEAPFAKYPQLCGTTVSLENIKISITSISSSKIPHEFRTTFAKKWLTETDIKAIRDIVPKNSKYIVCRLKSMIEINQLNIDSNGIKLL